MRIRPGEVLSSALRVYARNRGWSKQSRKERRIHSAMRRKTMLFNCDYVFRFFLKKIGSYLWLSTALKCLLPAGMQELGRHRKGRASYVALSTKPRRQVSKGDTRWSSICCLPCSFVVKPGIQGTERLLQGSRPVFVPIMRCPLQAARVVCHYLWASEAV